MTRQESKQVTEQNVVSCQYKSKTDECYFTRNRCFYVGITRDEVGALIFEVTDDKVARKCCPAYNLSERLVSDLLIDNHQRQRQALRADFASREQLVGQECKVELVKLASKFGIHL